MRDQRPTPAVDVHVRIEAQQAPHARGPRAGRGDQRFAFEAAEVGEHRVHTVLAELEADNLDTFADLGPSCTRPLGQVTHG